MDKELDTIEKRLDELLVWKRSKERERLSYPIDPISKKVLDTDRFAIIPTGRKSIAFHNLLETASLAFGLPVTINGKRRVLLCMVPFRQFSADATTDILTSSDGAHNLKSGDRILLTTSGALPSPLNNSTAYYVRDITTTTFKLSLTSGGAAINITDNGTGEHYWSQ